MGSPLLATLGEYRVKERLVRISFLGGVVTVLLKLIATAIANSLTLLTDLLRNSGETLAYFFTWLTLRKIARGKALSYEYGYGKLESLSSLLVAGVMLLYLIIALHGAIMRFQHPVVIDRVEMGFLVALASGGSSTWMWKRYYRLARQDRSPIVESQWRLSRAKAMANLCVVLSLGLSMGFSQYSWSVYIDPTATVVLAGFLVFSIYSIVSMNVFDLLDRALGESLQLIILRELTAYYDDYIAFHGMRSRRSGKHVYIDIFLQFDGKQTIAEVQEVTDKMKVALEQKIPGSHVVIAHATSRVV
jgi:cation diffusion facilitator family transporter